MEQKLPGEEAVENTYVDDYIVIDDDSVNSTTEDYVEPDYNENSNKEIEDDEAPDSYEAEAEEAPDEAETEETDEGIFENASADEVFTVESLVGDAQDAYTGNVSPDNDTNQNIQEALNEKIRVSNAVKGSQCHAAVVGPGAGRHAIGPITCHSCYRFFGNFSAAAELDRAAEGITYDDSHDSIFPYIV